MTENRINRISASDIRSISRPNLGILKKQHAFVSSCLRSLQLHRLIDIGQREPELKRAIKELSTMQYPTDAPPTERLLKSVRAERNFLAHACSAAGLYHDLLSESKPKWQFEKGEEAFLFLGMYVDHDIALQFGERLIHKMMPDIYRQLEQLKVKEVGDKEAALDHLKSISHGFETCLAKNNFKDFKVWGRAKSIFSIYLKSRRFGLERLLKEGIVDAIGCRILVTRNSECYRARDIMIQWMLDQGWQHRSFGRNDYIAKPKPNNYQSLHDLFCGEGKPPIEFQIRTFHMDEFAQIGDAAHSVYKFRRYFGGSKLVELMKPEPLDSWLALQKHLADA